MFTKNVKLPGPSGDRNPFNLHVAPAAVTKVSVCSAHDVSQPARGLLQEAQCNDMSLGLPAGLGAGEMNVKCQWTWPGFKFSTAVQKPINCGACPLPTEGRVPHRGLTVKAWR